MGVSEVCQYLRVFCVCVCVCVFSAWKDRPQCFKTRLWCPVWRVEFGNHPGKTNNVMKLYPYYVWVRLNQQACWIKKNQVCQSVRSPWFVSVFSMSWPQEGFLTPSGIVFLISWHKWWKESLLSSATQRRGSSPPSSSTLLTFGKHYYIQSQQSQEQSTKYYRLVISVWNTPQNSTSFITEKILK